MSAGPATLTRIEAAALRELVERPRHWQLVTGGLRVARALERKGAAVVGDDYYVRVVAP